MTSRLLLSGRRSAVLGVTLAVGVLTALPDAPAALAGLQSAVRQTDVQTQLWSVSAASATNAWTVGQSSAPHEAARPLLMRWNGTRWMRRPANTDGVLASVLTLSRRNAWAVGTRYAPSTLHPERTLTMHWDGTEWARVPSPTTRYRKSRLYDVDGTSANDLWAVGIARTRAGTARSVILHWDGVRWTRMRSPNPQGADNPGDQYILSSVSAAGTSEAWASGIHYEASSDTNTPLLVHWNGNAWSQVPGPDLARCDVSDIVTLAAGNAWAVGQRVTLGRFYRVHALTLHWDGKSWTRVASPDPGPRRTVLSGVDAEPTGDLWAAGYYRAPTAPHLRTLIMHGTGAVWSTVASSTPGAGAQLSSVSVASPTNAWAVGSFRISGSHTQRALILHWNGTRWRRVTTP